VTTPTSREDALTRTLADEYAAIYGYGLIASALVGPPRRRAQGAIDTHRVRRDQLRGLIGSLGRVPPNPAPAYDPPYPIDLPRRAAALAAAIESGLSGSYSQLAAQSVGPDRRAAALAAQEAAVRAAAWSLSTQAFPGTTTAIAGTSPPAG